MKKLENQWTLHCGKVIPQLIKMELVKKKHNSLIVRCRKSNQLILPLPFVEWIKLKLKLN